MFFMLCTYAYFSVCLYMKMCSIVHTRTTKKYAYDALKIFNTYKITPQTIYTIIYLNS